MILSVVDSENIANTIPSSYIHQLLMYQIRNTPESIIFDLRVLTDEYRFLHRVFMKNVDLQIPNIANLCTLFPRATELIIEVPILYQLSEEFVDSVIEDVSKIEKSINLQLQWPTGSDAVVQSIETNLWKHEQRLSAAGIIMVVSSEQCRVTLSDKKTKEATCICAAKMELLAAKDCYEQSGDVHCNRCFEMLHGMDLVYHCPLDDHPIHEQGYDICLECAANEWDLSYASGTCYISCSQLLLNLKFVSFDGY